jgi:heme oxygenase
MAPLLSPGLKLDEYKTVLEVLAGLHAALDRSLAAWEHRLPELQIRDRRKLDLILSDLAALGGAGANLHLEKVESYPIDNMSEVFGVLYVAEGSTLGGQVIAKHARQALGIALPTRFFQAYGDDHGRYWSSFLALLEDTPRLGIPRSAIARSAEWVFIDLLRRLDNVLTDRESTLL